MRKICLFLCLIVAILVCSSCKATTYGDTLHAFTRRMNKLSDTYTLSESGYILDQKSDTLTHFYKFGENEILLQFKTDDKNYLTEMNIVFNGNFTEGTEEFIFIKNCISAFIDNEETERAFFTEKSLSQLLETRSNKTVEINKGDTQLLLDVTDSGTVITVVKNNL
ncbi:MAG: hypothetical protein E7530_03135 [Ruminococcaceae bacterium]|nr:hypothetical protein [Oscillospiraceae bacterium]